MHAMLELCFDQSFGLQHAQGFANGCAADTKLAGNMHLIDDFSRLELAIQYVLPNAEVNVMQIAAGATGPFQAEASMQLRTSG